MKIVVDAYAWIEIFIGSKTGEKVREKLAEADEIYTPDVVMAEIARKYLREGAEQQMIFGRLKTIVETSDIASINMDVAFESARCHMELSAKSKKEGLKAPSLFDAIVLATARVLNAKVITGDKHFKNLSETLWIG